MKKVWTICCLFLGMLAAGCTDGKDVYNIPDNLDGEIYKQLSQDERFSTFVAAIDKVPGLKEELNTSGLYTVFAPTNDAFTAYFNSNGKYHTLAEIPTDELTRIVKFHVLKWMVFSYQFANPGATKEAFDVFKYVTRSNVKYSEYSETLKKQVSLYYENKYIQVYTPNFFSYYNVSAADYQRVFGANSQVSSPFNVLGASVLQADIASGNGVIHIIDRVLDVPTNIAQELDQNTEYSSYNAVLKRRYVSYAFDLAGTRLQGNYGDPNNDGILDSLFRRTYSIIPGLDYEKGFSLTGYIPTKQAFENYMLNLTNIFGSEAVVPTYTLDLLFKSHFANSMYWPSKVENGLAYNLLQNVVDLKPEDINSVKMLTNGLFYQTKKVVEPDAFKSVSAPAFFSKNYSLLGRLLFVSNYYNALSVKSSKITFFAPTDDAFAKIGISYNTTDPLKPVFTINDAGKVRNMSTTEMENLLGNNAIIGELNPASFTDGFYETLNGSIIQVKDGVYFNDKDSIPVITIPGQAKSNGYVYGVNRFLSIPKPSYTFIINTLQTPEYTEFLKIIQTVYPSFATSGFSFINQSADLKYTILIPSNDAVNNARAEGLIPVLPESSTDPTYAAKKEELLQFVRYHVLKGRSMTDGKVVGNIETAHYVKSSPTSTKEIYVPISVSSANGGLTITDGKGRSASTLPGSDRICKDGVIHLIDKVLTY